MFFAFCDYFMNGVLLFPTRISQCDILPRGWYYALKSFNIYRLSLVVFLHLMPYLRNRISKIRISNSGFHCRRKKTQLQVPYSTHIQVSLVMYSVDRFQKQIHIEGWLWIWVTRKKCVSQSLIHEIIDKKNAYKEEATVPHDK